MRIMGVLKNFSLDLTFDISSRSNDILYSLVVRHPDTGKGVPVGYMITNDQSVTPVLNWLRFLKNNCAMSPEQIAVDCSIPESDAIRATFDENCRIQLFKNSPGQYSSANLVRGNIMSDLQSIMYETSCETVVEKSIHGCLTAIQDHCTTGLSATKPSLSKAQVDQLVSQCAAGKIRDTLENIASSFANTDDLLVLHNHELNNSLTQLASIISSDITKANKSYAIPNIQKRVKVLLKN
ncbi:hypothetical protein G6F57_001889 [Rhizopus arrhizus]|nr:hypothetical protein G6F30_001482 [Rhizopus arrhizus]KAG1423446.1 hypothetical protein G6F58_002810 [Rhizopus delemar]KAG0986614.1 hypothetical protein G6F29_003128 [Rhizopus arrhizus]KAG0997910.1 hypothetical protein G6F28_002455 [Rhizopus arrhizus]KAG1012658.1 hypothetical protein G6F27_002618 [Rhizopus arrhizus]